MNLKIDSDQFIILTDKCIKYDYFGYGQLTNNITIK